MNINLRFYSIFRPTLDRLWATIVIPFSKMEVTDAEIVTLHILLLWSAQSKAYIHLYPI